MKNRWYGEDLSYATTTVTSLWQTLAARTATRRCELSSSPRWKREHTQCSVVDWSTEAQTLHLTWHKRTSSERRHATSHVRGSSLIKLQHCSQQGFMLSTSNEAFLFHLHGIQKTRQDSRRYQEHGGDRTALAQYEHGGSAGIGAGL